MPVHHRTPHLGVSVEIDLYMFSSLIVQPLEQERHDGHECEGVAVVLLSHSLLCGHSQWIPVYGSDKRE